MKAIVPNKLIVYLNEDGSAAKSILHYRMRIDGAMDNRKFFTMEVNAGVKIEELNHVITDSISHANKGEKIAIITKE
jgi:hypothetical protein